MVTATELRAYLRAGPKADEAFVVSCLTAATGTVERHIGTASVPEEVKDQAILQVAGNLLSLIHI